MLLTAISLHAAERADRTGADEDSKLPWFQIVPHEFPPADSAHYFAGELTGVDPINRRGSIRGDRTDRQRRSHWDLPVHFRLLPYAAVWFPGAPAALRDVPVGTHLHGLFYFKEPGEEVKSLFCNRRAIDGEFTRAFQLEHDFSWNQRRGRSGEAEAHPPRLQPEGRQARRGTPPARAGLPKSFRRILSAHALPQSARVADRSGRRCG